MRLLEKSSNKQEAFNELTTSIQGIQGYQINHYSMYLGVWGQEFDWKTKEYQIGLL